MSAPHIHPLDKCFTRNDEFALYDRVVSYAELLRGLLKDARSTLDYWQAYQSSITSDRVRNELVPAIDAALAKNPNPAGTQVESKGDRPIVTVGTCVGCGQPVVEGQPRAAHDLHAGCTRHETCTEPLASWMRANGFTTGHGDDVASLLRELAWQIEELRGSRHQSWQNEPTDEELEAATRAVGECQDCNIESVARAALKAARSVHQVGRDVCATCNGTREVLHFTGNGPCPDCATDAAVDRAVAPNMVAEALCRLENAEPLLRGFDGPVLQLAHQNVEEALRFLRGIRHPDYEFVACTKQEGR